METHTYDAGGICVGVVRDDDGRLTLGIDRAGEPVVTVFFTKTDVLVDEYGEGMTDSERAAISQAALHYATPQEGSLVQRLTSDYWKPEVDE